MEKITPELIAFPPVPNPPVPLKEKKVGNGWNGGFFGHQSTHPFPGSRERVGNGWERVGMGGIEEPPKPAPAALPPTPPAPRSWLHLDSAWRQIDALYLQHHWTCTTCKTAGAGRGARCEVGQRQHDALAQAVKSA